MGNAAIVVMGGPVEERPIKTGIMENSWFLSLGAADRAEFIASTIAELQWMLDEIRRFGK
jgi:hypothetical protein